MVCRGCSLPAIIAVNKETWRKAFMPMAIAMLMRNAPRNARDDAYCKLAREYPDVVLIIAARGDNQPCNLNEQGLKARREAQHDCKHRHAGRISGAQS